MNINDQPKLGQLLEEMCAIFGKPYGEPLLRGYYRMLKGHTFEAVSRAVVRLLADENLRRTMPTPADIKAVARHLEHSTGGGSIEDERWRRQYDAWQRGGFGDEALGKAMAMTDGELGVGQESGATQTYVHCQQTGCPGLIEWPPPRTDTGRLYCPHHQSGDDATRPVTMAEKVEILRHLTPGGRVFLRSILPGLMTDIPVSDDEQEAAEIASLPTRAKAFERTATGPGVNPSVFLNQAVTEDTSWMDGYRKASEIMVAGGFRYDAEEAVWKRGRQTLTDDQLGRMDEEVLRMFVGRR